MKYYLFITVLTTICSCNVNSGTNDINKNSNVQIKNIEKDTPVFQIYGESAPIGYLDDENPITEKYGFRFKRVAGCEIDNIDIKKINQQNSEALEIMNEKYGENWRQEFENETKLKLAIPL